MEKQMIRVDVGVAAALRAMPAEARVGMKGHWEITCRGKDGKVKWTDTIDNIVVNAGLNYLLDAGLSGGTPITTWYLGLLSATPTVAAADVMNSHGGWTEVIAYDEATRVAFVDGGVASQSCSNSGSPGVFTISANGTAVGGAFLTSGSAKSGTTGTLYAAGAFTAGNKDLDDNDTLTVTLTATAAAA
jgi:hypothetical protein